MLVAFALRLLKVKTFWPYVILGGGLSWVGLIFSHLHPALALVFIIPFMPSNAKAEGDLFDDEEKDDSTMQKFEHAFKYFVDFGLLGFGLANAGVSLGGIGPVTWVVFLSLLVGKTAGIVLFSGIASRLGMNLPDGMGFRTLLLSGVIAGVGLTVALFVAGQAFPGLSPQEQAWQGAAKMGAIFSGAIALIAFVMAKLMRVKRLGSKTAA